MNDGIQVLDPLFLLISAEACWQCRAPQTVIAIGAHRLIDEYGEVGDSRGLILLSNITAMPAHVWEYIRARNPRYVLRQSRTAESTYYANTCECGALIGDFYLFSEPGGAFFPLSPNEAAGIKYHRMPFDGPFAFECSYSQGPGDAILAHGINESA